MVRAGVVDHPKMWPFCGYNEIQDPPSRYRIIDLDNLVGLMGFADLHNFQLAHKSWIDASLLVDANMAWDMSTLRTVAGDLAVSASR